MRPVDGVLAESLVVDLGVRGPSDGVDLYHPFWGFVVSETGLHRIDDRGLVERTAFVQLDHGGDGLAEAFVGNANHHGIPITSVSRTLLDLAATITPDRLERALAQAERLQRYDHTAILDVIERTNGHRGRTPLARATAREPKLTRSEAEARFLQLAREAALSEPLANFTLTAPDHPRLEVDFYWPTHRLIVEIDGWETHRTRAAFRCDRRRDAALIAIGCRVVRFSYEDIVDEPATTQRRLKAATRT